MPVIIADDLVSGRGGGRQGRRPGHELRDLARRQAGPLRRPRRHLHRPGQVRQHPQPDRDARRPRAGLQVVARRPNWIAYISDAAARTRSASCRRTARGGPRQLTTRRRHLQVPASVWSPDSKKILWNDKKLSGCSFVDVDDQGGHRGGQGQGRRDRPSYAWSPDSRWIAYAQARGRRHDQGLSLLPRRQKTYEVTDGWYDSCAPVLQLATASISSSSPTAISTRSTARPNSTTPTWTCPGSISSPWPRTRSRRSSPRATRWRSRQRRRPKPAAKPAPPAAKPAAKAGSKPAARRPVPVKVDSDGLKDRHRRPAHRDGQLRRTSAVVGRLRLLREVQAQAPASPA